jgi:hypothetical protein
MPERAEALVVGMTPCVLRQQLLPAFAHLPPRTLHDPLLNGLRTLDLTSVILGPYATQILGDLGAEIAQVRRRRATACAASRRRRRPANPRPVA